MPFPPLNTDIPAILSTPTPIQVSRYARNKLIPNAELETQLANSINTAAYARRKELFRSPGDLLNIPAGATAARTRWRFASHTGVNLRRLRATVVMASSSFVKGVTDNPTVTVYITNADESTTYGSATANFGASGATVNDTPDEFGWFDLEIEGVPADTDVYGRFEESDGGRLVSAMVYEEAKPITSANGYITPAGVSVGSPIYDARRQTAYELATSLHKRGAAHLWNFSVSDQSAPFTIATGSSATNIIDGTSTAVSAASPGATLDTRYCKTRSATTVPCVLQVFGSVSVGGTTGDVYLKDSTGSTVATVNGFTTTAGWHSTTLNLAAALDKYDLQAVVTAGAGNLSIGAVSLYQYAA